ncbi:MAG: hypothetical protein WD200_03050 [Candidatus Andersenbacteria bacterium]
MKRAISFFLVIACLVVGVFEAALPEIVYASSEGPLIVGTGANDNSFGTAAWSSPENITANDGTDAAVGLSNSTSQYLKATNFGFDIPAGATIDGIVVEVEKYANAVNIFDARARIVKGGVVGSTDKASGTQWDNGTPTIVSYGAGTTDLWGESWTADDINASTFGFVIAATTTGTFRVALVDFIRITVYYTRTEGMPASSNYQLRGFGFGSGGTADSSSDNYRLNAISGETSSSQLSGSSYDLGSGLNYIQQANVPPAPAFTNDGNYYNKLNLIIDNGSNPTDATFAIAISTDAFASETNYIQSDNTVGATLGSEDYQTYASWGGASGFEVIGLEPGTTYTVKVKAMHGDFTETDWGPTDDAATAEPELSFDIDVSATDSDTSAPFTIDLGDLTAGSVIDSTEKIWVDLDTNAEGGGRVYVVGDNAGLVSSLTAYTIDSSTADLSAATEGYGAQGSSVAESSGGPLSITAAYDLSDDNVGVLDTAIREIFSTENPIVAGRGSFLIKAKSSAVTPAASDYTDILTLIASATF